MFLDFGRRGFAPVIVDEIATNRILLYYVCLSKHLCGH